MTAATMSLSWIKDGCCFFYIHYYPTHWKGFPRKIKNAWEQGFKHFIVGQCVGFYLKALSLCLPLSVTVQGHTQSSLVLRQTFLHPDVNPVLRQMFKKRGLPYLHVLGVSWEEFWKGVFQISSLILRFDVQHRILIACFANTALLPRPHAQ